MPDDDRPEEFRPEEFRSEHDSMGEVRVPADAHWGAQTQRAIENFPVSGLPIAPSLVSFGLVRLVSKLAHSPERRRGALAVALGVAALSTFVRSASAHSWYEYPASDVELCRTIGGLSAPDDRVVVLGSSDPKLLFCIDRRGWLLPSAEDDGALRTAWEAGARLVVVPKSLPDGSVRKFLAGNGSVVHSTMETDLVRLPPRPSAVSQ